MSRRKRKKSYKRELYKKFRKNKGVVKDIKVSNVDPKLLSENEKTINRFFRRRR